ncbi:hypothetical protein [Anianabacter salinae]|uniref:hypothetical protein n=1 Tax=Anianabacter salinae TaxID=2851023 RepID=UPI00225E4CC0|nr:hypothetical protein [Anianabacter salinae]MBV0913458.1 hypothetical protein [Anianabacter salinae]
MKKFAALGLAAALVAATGTSALAQQTVQPINPNVSTQTQLVALGALTPGAIVLGTIIVAGVIYAIVDSGSQTNP